VHLALLAPLHAKLCSVDDLPSLDARTAAVLYPDDAAIPAEDVDVGSITDVVVVDSKWGQSRGILASDKLRNLRHIRLGTYVTSYWRRARVPCACARPAARALSTRRAGTTLPAFPLTGCAQSKPSTLCAARCAPAGDSVRLHAHQRSAVLTARFGPRQLHSKVHGAGGSTTDCHCFDNLLWCAIRRWRIALRLRADEARGACCSRYFAFQKKMVEQASAARRTKQAAGLPAADG
jgi:hypothetical protein